MSFLIQKMICLYQKYIMYKAKLDISWKISKKHNGKLKLSKSLFVICSFPSNFHISKSIMKYRRRAQGRAPLSATTQLFHKEQHMFDFRPILDTKNDNIPLLSSSFLSSYLKGQILQTIFSIRR